jgi:cytochrome P450
VILPPKPASRPRDVPFWKYVRLFRQDIFTSQPARLYRAWLAEFRTPFFRSFLVNQPDLVRAVLQERPRDFPKSDRVGEGLRPLLGRSVFVTNGDDWERQRRIIDPAFAGGRLRDVFPAMLAAGHEAVARLAAHAPDEIEIEAETAHLAADVIFRTLFSIPITHHLAAEVFDTFRDHQRAQPLLNLAALLPLPRLVPRFHSRTTRATARRIRAVIGELTRARQAAIDAGTAPDDLATKIMTMTDPVTGARFDTDEMADQVAIFFLAGHETSASALAWALYCLALDPASQERVAAEAVAFAAAPTFSGLSRLGFTRDVWREALRLYPPVPMMVRAATRAERFRARDVPPGSQIVISPWHLHRHERLWDNPDAFDPGRWGTANGRACLREAFIPFSAGPRVCTGAGFAMAEGVLMLSLLTGAFRLAPVPGRVPVPVAHLTVRARDGIWLRLTPRGG